MEKKKINSAVKLTGWLKHDNKLFSLTCSQCHGMYEGGTNCPKCQAPLVNITTSQGTPMAISEGTIKPMIGKATGARYEQNISNTKDGMPAHYRFKIFSFADGTNRIPIPPIHSSLKYNALVEVMIFDHPVEHKFFANSRNQLQVECMHKIYPHYGDTVKVLTAAAAADTTVSHEVNPDGTPTPMSDPYPDALNAQPTDTMAALKTLMERLAALEQAEAQRKGVATAECGAGSIPGDDDVPF